MRVVELSINLIINQSLTRRTSSFYSLTFKRLNYVAITTIYPVYQTIMQFNHRSVD